MGGAVRMASGATLLAVVVAVLVQVSTGDALVADVCYLGVLVGASAAAWVGVARWPRGQRLMPRLVAAGLSLTALGDVLWTVLDRAGAETDVSVADLAWFASYVLLCAALWVVLSRSQGHDRVDVGVVVDAVTIVVITVLVFWTLSVDAIIADTTVSPFVRTVWAAYPVLDGVLLALVLRVVLSRRGRAAIDSWFAVGVCLWLAADMLYLLEPDQPTAVKVMNAAWMLAPVLMARAVWRVRDGSRVAPGRSATPGGWVAQLLIAVFPLIVPPALELYADLRGEPDEPVKLFVGMTVVMTLALVRTGRLIRSEQRAHRELEAARDAAMAASQAKSMFLANMSHEIRTPLTTVLVTAALMEDTPLDDHQQNLLAKMHRSGERLQSLVEGVLDFSRIEAGRAVLQPAEFDLHALVAELVDVHVAGARHQGIAFDCAADPDVPQTVVGDRTRVFQVLNNLVENALKFTRDGGVHLGVRPVEGGEGAHPWVQFAVTDTGIGIAAADQKAVFESFTQVDGSFSRRYQGTGLGLAICKDLTELMGGTITLRSEPGVGSTFTVRLPLTPPISTAWLADEGPGAVDHDDPVGLPQAAERRAGAE